MACAIECGQTCSNESSCPPPRVEMYFMVRVNLKFCWLGRQTSLLRDFGHNGIRRMPSFPGLRPARARSLRVFFFDSYHNLNAPQCFLISTTIILKYQYICTYSRISHDGRQRSEGAVTSPNSTTPNIQCSRKNTPGCAI